MPAIFQGDSVRVDTSGFEDAMAQYLRLKKVSLSQGVREQAKLLAKELIADTPPTKGTVGGKSLSARAAGRARVARDITRAVRPLDPREWQSKVIRDLIRRKDYEALAAVMERFSSDTVLSFEDIIHIKARVAGRVRKKLPQATPDHQEHRAYVKKVQDRVGTAKGGWVASFEKMGGKAPAWLQSKRSAGTVVDLTQATDPSVEMINRANWAEDSMATAIVNKALRRRQGRMVRWIEGALAAAARKAGLS